MEFKYIAIAGIVLVALLVCGCAGAVAVVMPAINDELPASRARATIDPAAASDPIVGAWKLLDPIFKHSTHTVDMTDATWRFGIDGSYEEWPLTIGIFKTTGTWSRIGTGHYEVACGKGGEVKHFDLTGDQLTLVEDQRYVLIRKR